jgi:toxin CptA
MTSHAGVVAASGRASSRRLPTLYVAVRASRRLAWILCALHAIALGVLATVSIPAYAKAAGIVAVLATGIRAVRRHALLAQRDACVAVRLKDNGKCEIVRRDGSLVEGRIHGGTALLAGVTIVRVTRPGHRRRVSVVLMRDAVDRDAMRRLKVRLRWAGEGRTEQFVRDLSL